MTRPYYSERQGRGPKATALPFEQIQRLVFQAFDAFFAKDYFQEAFGYYCVDVGDVEGTLGADRGAHFLLTTFRNDLWPYRANAAAYDADALFDVVEILYDLVSAPTKGRYHDFSGCGWHYHAFDRETGQEEYREALNGVLKFNDPSLELQASGEIVAATPDAFRPLLEAGLPEGTENDEVASRITTAVKNWRDRHSSADDRRKAVRDLADVLEYLRPTLKTAMLPADENDLFNIVNNFNVRHNNRSQRREYDDATWLSWMFYVYLATAHAAVRVRARLAKDAA